MEVKQSSDTEPIFTINDFPTEIVERFAPDLRPRTVSTLRLVSPRFRDVFSSDLYYRSYLCYKNRLEFYREDLEEFGEARDRWRRCLEAEKRRLDNWRQGRPTRVETVQIPSNERRVKLTTSWSGTVGAGNNLLIMCELKNRKILLANVTKDPIMTVVDVSSYTQRRFNFAHLLADQVVIDDHNGLKQVFSILNEEGKHTLKHVFTIETTVGQESYISGFSDSAQSYRNFYVYVSHSEVGILRVWDLKRDALPDNLVLKELLPPNHASKLGECYRVNVQKTEFPYVLMRFGNIRDFLYLAVNVEEKHVACCVACEGDKILVKWLVKGRELFMEFGTIWGSARDIRIYGLQPWSQPCSEPQLLFTSQNRTSFPHFEPPWLIGTKLTNNELTLTHIDESSTQILRQTHPYAIDMSLHAVVGPFFIVKSLRSNVEHGDPSMYSRQRFSRLVTLDKAGETLFEWSKMLAANGADDQCGNAHCEMPPLFHSLSKWVVQNGDRNTLYICHF